MEGGQEAWRRECGKRVRKGVRTGIWKGGVEGKEGDGMIICTYETFSLKGRVAGGVLRKLMGPELPVRMALVDPVLVHKGKQIQLAVELKPLIDGLTCVRRDDCTVWLAIRGRR